MYSNCDLNHNRDWDSPITALLCQQHAGGTYPIVGTTSYQYSIDLDGTASNYRPLMPADPNP